LIEDIVILVEMMSHGRDLIYSLVKRG